MGERKVLNKYIPADFDPALVPRGTKLSSKDGTVPVRMMLPFSIQCSTCQTFLYRGRKFNSKKEPMGGPDGKYLGITRWRFYIKCTQCARPITFCTDPQRADYEMESGGTRNYEVYKDKQQTEDQVEQQTAEEEKLDPMKALENRVAESQREMAELDALEQIKALNARHAQLLSSSSSGGGGVGSIKGSGADMAKAVLDTIEAAKKKQHNHDDGNEDDDGTGKKEELLTEEDEALIRSIKFGQQQQPQNSTTQSSTSNATKIIRRLDEDDERKLDEQRRKQAVGLEERLKTLEAEANERKRIQQQTLKQQQIMPLIKVVKRKRDTVNQNQTINSKNKATVDKTISSTKQQEKENETEMKKAKTVGNETAAAAAGSTNLAGLLGGYSSSSDSSS